MTMGMQALSGLGLVYIILIFCRCILKWGDGSCGTDKRPGIGIAQTTGSRQVQADVAQIWDSSAGLMAVIADGIGSANTGKVCAPVSYTHLTLPTNREVKSVHRWQRMRFWTVMSHIAS